MTHSPYGRNPKTTNKPSPPPRGKVTTPEEARAANAAEPEAIGQESGPFRVTMEEAALVVAARDVADSFGLDPNTVAHGAARVLYALADANRLSAELSELYKNASPEFKEAYATYLDQAARVWLERRAEPKLKKRGRGTLRAVAPDKPTDVNPDAGHGAADGFGGTDFPTPGPDEDRPQ